MRLCAKFFLMAALLTASVVLFAQEQPRAASPDLLARLSFDSGGPLSPGSQRTCLAVDRDGSYRMMRLDAGLRMIGTLNPEAGEPMNVASINGDNATVRKLPDPTERFEGTLSSEQLQQLKTLVGASDLRPLAGNHVALIRQSAETFTAEIPAADKPANDGTLHVHLLNADGESPFPPPVRKIIDWLKGFEPNNAKPAADLEFRDVCPGGGFQLVQPAVSSAP